MEGQLQYTASNKQHMNYPMPFVTNICDEVNLNQIAIIHYTISSNVKNFLEMCQLFPVPLKRKNKTFFKIGWNKMNERNDDRRRLLKFKLSFVWFRSGLQFCRHMLFLRLFLMDLDQAYNSFKNSTDPLFVTSTCSDYL